MLKKKCRKILSAIISTAMLSAIFTPYAALGENNDYILNISDTKIFNHTNNTTTQTGSANLYYYGGTGSSISSDGQDEESDKPIKVKQTVMTDWKSAFWTEAKNYSTSKNTVFDIEFKVSLEDYSKPSPYIGLRLYTTNNYMNCDAMEWRGIQLASADKDKLHHMRYVLSKGDDGKAVARYSLDGADYKIRTGEAVSDSALNWGYTATNGDTAQLRFMPMALPSTGRDDKTLADGVTALDTAVNWEFYSFKAYQTSEIPEPPKATTTPTGEKNYILNLSDAKFFDDRVNQISQDGSVTASFYGYTAQDGTISTRVYSDAARSVSSAPIKVKQTRASEYKTAFLIPGEKFVTSKNIVFDVKYKVYLDDYTKTSPYVGLKLSHDKSAFIEVNGMSWRGQQLNESDKDKVHTMRYVVSPSGNETKENCARIYYSYDGAAYTIDDRSVTDLTALENYGTGNLRLWPVAIPRREDFNIGTDDGEKAIETGVNWEIESVQAYQTDEIPDPITDDGDDEPLPTARPVATAVPIPSELKDSIVRAYPDGKMKAAVISLDDGADWCAASDIRAMGILREHGIKATFNLVPGNATANYLNNIAETYKGMEVASHSNTHPQLDEATNDTFVREIEVSKATISNAWGSDIGGLAYPYSCKASSDPVRLRMVQDAGYRYARNCIVTGNYNVPESFYDLNPTGWVSIERDWNNGTTRKHMENFKAMDASSEWKLMLMSGHAWQFNADETAAEPRGDIWAEFEEFVKYLEDNKDTIWNPTTIELADYVTACRRLTVTKNDTGASIYNPADITVWANIDGEPVSIGAGQTISVRVKPEPAEKPFAAKNYIFDVDDNIEVNDKANSIVDTGNVMQSTAGVMSSSTSDVFVVRQQKKSVWGGYLNIVAPAPANVRIDKPVVIEAKYKADAEEYSAATPKARLALALTNFDIYANSNASTEIFTPADGDGFKTVKFVVDPVSGKIYTISDGKLISTVSAKGLDTNAMFTNGIRLYMNVCPSDDNMSNDGDGTLELTSAINWNFDYVKVYKLEDTDTLRIVTNVIDINNDTAEYNVSIRNDHPSISEHAAAAVALYDSTGKLVKIDVRDFDAACLTKTVIKGAFDVSGLTNYRVNAFLWDGVKTMKPVTGIIDLERAE